MLSFNPYHPVLPFSSEAFIPLLRESMREPIDDLHCRLFLLRFYPPRDVSFYSSYHRYRILNILHILPPKDSYNFFKLSLLLTMLSSLPGCLSDSFRLPLSFLSTVSRVLNTLKRCSFMQECTVKYPSHLLPVCFISFGT
jgi:hypothetical protein